MTNLVFLHNLSLETHLEDDCLLVLVSSHQIPDPDAIVTFICQGVASLKIPSLKIIRIFGHEDGKNFPSWVKEINLQPKTTISKTPQSNNLRVKLAWLMISLPITLSILGGFYWLMQLFFWKNSGFLQDFSRINNTSQKSENNLQNNLPQALKEGRQASDLGKLAQTQEEWNQVQSQWQKAIAILAAIPENSEEYPQAQLKLEEYKKNLSHAQKQPEYYRQGINEATEAVKLGKTAKSQTEWQEVSNKWQKAIASLQGVKIDDPHYAQSQEKLPQYEQYYIAVQNKIEGLGMELKKTITGNISPKSIVYSGNGLFFAQNMMYRHNITIYDQNYNLVKTLSDQVKLSDYGHKEYLGTYQGSPVEVAFSHNGQYAWVSNYQMYGTEFTNPGSDRCGISPNYDPSFVYRINTQTLTIDQAVKVGSVPKYVATSPDNRFVLTSNWCSGDLSIINTQNNREIKRIFLGSYPRGIAIDQNSQKAYIAIMGSRNIAIVDLENFSLDWLNNIGSSPRHLILDPDGEHLYVSLNGDGQIARLNVKTQDYVKIKTGNAPRSMTLSKTGKYLYVVNYNSHTVTKIRTSDMKLLQTVKTPPNPIGITYDPQKEELWVASYSGSIVIFKDLE
jgi:YVTN family beta-propeller protein